MAGRPSKPYQLLKSEGKTHLTKAEEAQRKAAEAATLTGRPMKAWKSLTAESKKEFSRIKRLFKLIDKDDDIYTNVINRYCQLYYECEENDKMVEEFRQAKRELEREYRNPPRDDKGNIIDIYELTASRYYKLVSDMQKNINTLERMKQQKREMMLRIEKENIMTVASALRSIPKKVQKKEEGKTGVGKFTARYNTTNK